MNYYLLIFKMIIIYIVMIILLRILGKREVGQLSIFDLVVLLIIADIASLGVDNNDFFVPSLICLIILVFLQKVLSVFLLHNAKFRSLIDGNPTIIVKNGNILVENMRKEKYTIDDLLGQMRSSNILNIEDVKLAILESNGNLSIFNEKDIDKVNIPIITSGIINKDSLDVIGVEITKIKKVFNDNNINIKDVLYASLGKDIIYYFLRKGNKEKELKVQTIKMK